MAKKYYAVRKGRETGVFSDWESCKKQVMGFKGAEYKSFPSKGEAEAFLELKKASLPVQGPMAYVDGSFSKEDGSYAYGVVFLEGEKVDTYSGRFPKDEYGDMRNVAGELRGACRAIEEALRRGHDSITLYYDYAGIEKWADGSWKRNKKGTIEYKKFIDEASRKIQIYFVKVPAHSGVKYNEWADELAKNAKMEHHSPEN